MGPCNSTPSSGSKSSSTKQGSKSSSSSSAPNPLLPAPGTISSTYTPVKVKTASGYTATPRK
ncbi:hypothetical protein PG996_011266 [Apiospora saccharicola]|uniref:Uncharacterized protein n=1 Tax=Apiospora saccharicola TaxID=335842 RepID=A0ABR1UEJ9_9PEZI